jgi:hypothetical protein
MIVSEEQLSFGVETLESGTSSIGSPTETDVCSVGIIGVVIRRCLSPPVVVFGFRFTIVAWATHPMVVFMCPRTIATQTDHIIPAGIASMTNVAATLAIASDELLRGWASFAGGVHGRLISVQTRHNNTLHGCTCGNFQVTICMMVYHKKWRSWRDTLSQLIVGPFCFPAVQHSCSPIYIRTMQISPSRSSIPYMLLRSPVYYVIVATATTRAPRRTRYVQY